MADKKYSIDFTMSDGTTESVEFTAPQGDQGYYIVASVDRPAFSTAQWDTYGTIGREENWGGTSNSGVRVGDLFVVVGTATDTGVGHQLVYRYTGVKGGSTLSGVCIAHHLISSRGAKGADGKTPVKGTDYFTSADKAEIAKQAANMVNLADKISLGIASDGLIYVFIDGQPVGTGIPQGQSGDVFGYVDENNVITLTGNLDESKAYIFKYEMSDGSIIDVGEADFTPDVEVMVNLMETAYDTDLKTVYNVVGWKSDVRVKSDGTITTGGKNILTGFVPFISADDVYHIRGVEGITYLSGSHRGSVAYYSDSLTFLGKLPYVDDGSEACGTDELGDFTIQLSKAGITIPAGTKYMRFHLGSATGNVIMTRNQLITV